jgi:hypothetical protein
MIVKHDPPSVVATIVTQPFPSLEVSAAQWKRTAEGLPIGSPDVPDRETHVRSFSDRHGAFHRRWHREPAETG